MVEPWIMNPLVIIHGSLSILDQKLASHGTCLMDTAGLERAQGKEIHKTQGWTNNDLYEQVGQLLVYQIV